MSNEKIQNLYKSLKKDFEPVLGLATNESSMIPQSVNFNFFVEYFLGSNKLINIAFDIVDITENIFFVFFWASEWLLFVNSS